ncbi:MAG: hypothetical protein L0215_18895 [Gemmataceae bacterium]|nr:hypothetical protein [Gemmataceae bacterium]
MAKKAKERRWIRLVRAPDENGVGVFCLRRAKKDTYYVFKEIPCAIGGRGFVVHRVGLAEVYCTRVGEAQECSCECLGFLAHGNCKHILGLKALLQNEAV